MRPGLPDGRDLGVHARPEGLGGGEARARRNPFASARRSTTTGRCLPWSMATDCIVCEEWCPTSPKAVYLRPADVVDAAGNVKRVRQPYVDPDRCVGCGACEFACPVQGPAGHLRHEHRREPVGGQPDSAPQARQRPGEIAWLEPDGRDAHLRGREPVAVHRRRGREVHPGRRGAVADHRVPLPGPRRRRGGCLRHEGRRRRAERSSNRSRKRAASPSRSARPAGSTAPA